MKRVLFFSIAALTATIFTSCSKDKDDNKAEQPGATTESYIDASSNTAWHYYSFGEDKVLGSADESAENNAAWAARKDWDIAVRRYNIRTNSGEFTAAGAKGGVATQGTGVTFESLQKVPAGAIFVGDKAVTSSGMGGTTTVVRSEATVILFKQNEDGSLVMPPVYLPAPTHIFRTADGENYYKVRFTQYQNAESVTGHVKFDRAKIPQ
ncbi:MAG: HmuY family protein [Prevotellaceae bacterium]|jgi:hypothetical protein|nr:HmuY family protein [Prevotellaceae bacterium]